MAEKAKVLYIEDESNLREMLAVDLEATLPITVIECGTAEDAIKILQNDTTKEIVIVLSDYNLPGNNGDTIYEYIRQTRPEIPFILHTSVFVTELKSFANFVDENSYNRIVQKPEVEEITITIQKYLDIKQGEEQEAPKYCKIATKRFLMFNTLAFDIFLRLSENKFIKIINKNELYMVDTIEQYISRDCEYLYITSGDYVPFLDHFTKTIKDRLICQEIPPSEQISLEVDCADLIQNHINFFSISDELMAVVDVVTTSNLKLIKKDPQLKSVIECMIQRKGFILEHSLLISYVALAIANEMGWTSELTMSKLTLAAITHDIALSDDNMARDHDLIPRDIGQNHWRVQQQISNHPKEGAELLYSSPSIPDDVCNIVKYHHITGDGNSYPPNILPSQVPPLTGVIVVAEAFSCAILQAGGEWKNLDHIEAVMEIKNRFSKGAYAKSAVGLAKIFAC